MVSHKRIRIFAGPNGSGKSTLFQILSAENVDLGAFINADEILVSLKEGCIDFSQYDLELDFNAFCDSFKMSSRYEQSNGDALFSTLSCDGNIIQCSNLEIVNTYFAAFIADYVRDEMLSVCDKFTTETVMSHPSKLEYLRLARKNGFRVYLYFVSTRDPRLNIERVKQRSNLGGHNVPEDKIINRYSRSLDNLFEAVKLSHRAFLFDNSESKAELYVEYDADQDGTVLFHKDRVPLWIKEYFIDKI